MAVRPATIADADALEDVLADAFDTDPISMHLVPDSRRRRERLRIGMGRVMRRLYLPHGGAWTTDERDGVAMWGRPGDPTPSALEQLRDLPTFFRAFGRHVPRAMRAFETAEKRRPQEDHWYLELLAVRPDRQGQGVGSALLGATLPEVDAAGLPAFLVTSNARNVPLYERFGFVVGDEYDIGPVHVWPMLRPGAG